jgi:hypothetical protein
MNDTEWKILNEMLDDYAERLGNAGCNDYDLPDTGEGWEIAADVALESDDPDEEPRLCVMDFCVLNVLRNKLRKAVGR